MADKKISQLTGATTPLAGTEVLPIVQGGTTVKVSIDNVTKGRTVNATTFDTDVAAAGVTLTGTTLSADGTDSNIDVNVTPKGTGSVNLTKVNIDGGTIDGTIIGGASAAAATVTTLNASGSVSLNGAVTINDSAANADFRVESVNNLNMIFSDASADMVGIGTGTPSSRLHVFATNGWDSTEPVARIENLDQSTSQSAVMQLIGGWDGNPFLLKATQYGTPNKDRFVLNATGDITTYPGSGFHTVINEDGADSDFRVEGDADANLIFVDASTDRVGIGQGSPQQKLDVGGAARLGLVNRAGSYTGGATTVAVGGVSYLEIANSGATSITAFTGASAGQVLFLKFNDGNTTITRNNAYLAGSTNFTSTTNATLTLIYDGAAWFEVCRSTTNG